MASTATMTHQDQLNSQYLSNSFSSLSGSRSTNSLIVRTYKQATQQYLTKQFKEALETLEPIINPQPQSHGEHTNEESTANGDASSTNGYRPAPIAQSSRGTRTKVWVFYLSLLHAIIDLGPEQGKLIFGSTTWRQLAAKAREGTIWDEVVQHGYGGSEGEVDGDVITNLATLLLGHMQDQSLNQQRLETYLSASDSVGGNGHLSFAQDGTSTPISNASSSPKQLATRLKILELYTLHVLPANGEWDYSRQCIDMNDMLDEERKEAFINALQTLREEKDGTANREKELKEQREREMEEQRQEVARQAEAASKEADRKTAVSAENEKATPSTMPTPSGTTSTPKPTHTPKPSSSSNHAPPARSSKAQKKPPAKPSPPPSFYRRASSVLGNLQQLVLQASRSLSPTSSMALLRLLMFMVAFLLVIARRDLRLKIRRVMENGWTKVRQTVGMGVKVSYI